MDPDLRSKWDEINIEQVTEYSFPSIFMNILKAKSLSSVFDKEDFSSYILSEKAGDYIKGASDVIAMPKSLADVRLHKEFFSTYTRLPPRPRSGDEVITQRFNLLKEYRDFLNEHFEDFDAYEKNQKDLIPKWFEWTIKIFNHLRKSYKRLAGMTYADLEYLTFKSLKRKNSSEKIRNRYRYFIIDEFQDTSQIQFEIIRLLSGDDFDKVFAVGDLKQAIYGFRGGEVSIFNKCERLIPRSLELKNNYRSCPGIISFNNHFFSGFFPETFFQNPPEGKEYPFEGEVEMRVRHIEREERVDKKEVGFIESLDIIDALQEFGESTKTTCILYRKLASSLDLIAQMMGREMSFSAQVKIKNNEAPILILFLSIDQRLSHLSRREKQKQPVLS